MAHTRFFSALAILASLAAGCMQATDPGMNERYTVEFGPTNTPDYAIGKKFHWTTMPVKIKYNACMVSGCSNAIENSVSNGIDFWKRNASLYGEIQTTYVSGNADIEVYYKASTGGNVIGVCTVSLGQYSNGGVVAIKPLTLTIYTQVSGVTDSDYAFVSAHEMGHCLGLWEHSPRDGDLMYYLLTNKTGYTARDLNSIRWLYSQPTDVGTYPASASLQTDLTSVGFATSPSLVIP